jgi:hypothetical protein
MSVNCVVNQWLLGEGWQIGGHHRSDYIEPTCSGPLLAWTHPDFEPLVARYEHGAIPTT